MSPTPARKVRLTPRTIREAVVLTANSVLAFYALVWTLDSVLPNTYSTLMLALAVTIAWSGFTVYVVRGIIDDAHTARAAQKQPEDRAERLTVAYDRIARLPIHSTTLGVLTNHAMHTLDDQASGDDIALAISDLIIERNIPCFAAIPDYESNRERVPDDCDAYDDSADLAKLIIPYGGSVAFRLHESNCVRPFAFGDEITIGCPDGSRATAKVIGWGSRPAARRNRPAELVGPMVAITSVTIPAEQAGASQ
ncbi:hypothetical protein GCM10022252_76420 [Streptosporangium oxazolinicum]|uniref:Histidine kinase n=1 Tax=Streptosporangium oxazolinicum TaxID=909287 RepID=A0ABP8BL77_9ACTN